MTDRTRPLRLSLLASGAFALLLAAGGCGGDTEPTETAAADSAAPGAEASPDDAAGGKLAAGGGAAPASDAASRYRQAPDFELARVGGGELSLSSLRGKVVLIDFWATWCGPCRRGIPHLNALYGEHREAGLEVVGISVDRSQRGQSPEQLVQGFMKQTPMSYPNVLADANVARAYGGIQSIPTAFLIDREGRIRRHYVGLQPPDVFERDIRELLAEPAPGDDDGAI